MAGNYYDTYIVTGATGYIGSMLVRRILSEGSNVALVVRNLSKAEKIFDNEIGKANIKIFVSDVTDPDGMKSAAKEIAHDKKIKNAALIHAASETKSKYMLDNPAETLDTIILGTRNVLEMMRSCDGKIKSMVHLSSMEAYGIVSLPEGERAGEEMLGMIDMTSPRSSYPLGKRTAEFYCMLYAKEFGVPVKVARLAQVFGAGVPSDDSRAFAQFARAAMTGEDIVLETSGESMGNYCSIDEAIDAIMLILREGKNGETYNVVNEENTMRVRDMARVALDTLGTGAGRVITNVGNGKANVYAPNTKLMMSGKKLAALGFSPRKSLADMYRDLARDKKTSNPTS